MPTFDQITWLPICAALTGLGVVAAFFAFRRRGAASGLRLLGWAVLPMAIYLTGLARFLYTVVAEAVRWVGKFVFAPTVWAGVILFGVAFVLLGTAGVLRRRKAARATDPATETGRSEGTEKAADTGKRAKAEPEKPKQVGKGEPADNPLEGMDDVDEILKRRGIE